MGRGKGVVRAVCFCRQCHRNFPSVREDAATCSAKCRKAWNRLMGGEDDDRERDDVTDMANVHEPGVFRVLLDGRHVASYGTRHAAEMAIFGWRREWDGEFVVRSIRKSVTGG